MIAITASTIAPAAAMHFQITGYVNYCNETAADDPTVTVKNMRTGYVHPDVSESGDNYYVVIILPEYPANLTDGDILCFDASKGDNKNIFNHTVTVEEMDNLGFNQDIMIGMCGDANCDNEVNMGDGKKVAKGEGITCEWAMDVNCDKEINMGDGKKIAKGVLNCCP